MSEKEYAFLNEEVPAEVVPEVAAEPVAETVEVVPQAPTPAPVAPTATEPLEATHVPLAALRAEREKRQAHERRIAELEASLAPKEPQPNFYDQPEQFVHQVVQSERQQMTQALYAALEADARDANPDYDEVLAELNEAARDNPAIRQQVFASPNPAKAAYKLGKQMREMKAMQDPAAYRAKVEAEIRASIKAETDAAESARAAAIAAVPPDLAAARSSRDQEVVVEDTLDSILASRKKR